MVQKRSMSPKEASSMHEKKASAISHYIEMRVVGNNVTVGDDEEKELKAYFAKLSPRERADFLYDKVMAHLIFGYPIKFPERALPRKEEASAVKWI